MEDFQVVYMSDCTTLAHCLRDNLQSELYNYTVRLQDLGGSLPVPDAGDISISHVVVLVVSLESFTFLRSKPHGRRNIILSSIFPDKSTGVLVFTGVTEKEFTDTGIAQDYNKYNKLWKYHASQNINDLSDMLKKCHKMNEEDTSCYQYLPSPVPVCRLYPDTVYSTDQEILVVSSEAHTNSDTIAIEIDGNRLNTTVKRLNPYSCTFKIHRIYSYGYKTLTIWKEETGDLIGRCKIEVIPSSEAVDRILQSSLNTDEVLHHVPKSAPIQTGKSNAFINELSRIISRGSSCPDGILESFGGRPTASIGGESISRSNRGSTHSTCSGSSTSSARSIGHGNRRRCDSAGSLSAVDETMALMFAESGVIEKRDVTSAKASSNMISSPYVSPTWLHFAARYGMDQLATAIMDSPIADDALFIVNADGDLTDALARKRDNLELSETLRERMTSIEIDDLYETPVTASYDSDAGDDDYVNIRDREQGIRRADSGHYSMIGDIGSDGGEYWDMSKVQHKPPSLPCPGTPERGDKSKRRSVESVSSADSGCSMSSLSRSHRGRVDEFTDMCSGTRYSDRSGLSQIELIQQHRKDKSVSVDDDRVTISDKQLSHLQDENQSVTGIQETHKPGKKHGTLLSKLFGKKTKDPTEYDTTEPRTNRRASDVTYASLSNAQLGSRAS